MKKTFNLFLVSISIIVLTFVVGAFWDYLEFGENKTPLALTVTVAFRISIAGIILGISDIRKKRSTKILIGLVGHLIVLLFFILAAGYALKL